MYLQRGEFDEGDEVVIYGKHTGKIRGFAYHGSDHSELFWIVEPNRLPQNTSLSRYSCITVAAYYVKRANLAKKE